MNDLYWIGPALLAGLFAVRFGLPPLVGYLLAGFVLNHFGFVDHDRLSYLGDLGVTLLLFTIGLKLDVRSLFRPVIWAGTTLHMSITIILFGTGLYWLSLSGLSMFTEIDLKKAFLIGFALSFSSTVFAVKALEDRGEYVSKYGQLAIGVLIMQDIYAVVFLAISAGKFPSVWAFGLLALIPLRGLLVKLLDHARNGELQILLGISIAFGSWALFNSVDIKGDLGALIFGALLANHPVASDISKKLLGFKDLLLVGFFLSIGMSGNISLSALLIAFVLALLVIIKVFFYHLFFTQFKVRARTSFLASLSLANYSEFGLIVGAIAVSNGWLSGDWLVTIALALTMTFIAAASLNINSRKLYTNGKSLLNKFESQVALPEDSPVDIGEVQVAIAGMGRVGTCVYDNLNVKFGGKLIGIDIDSDVVKRHQEANRNVICADLTDDEFWIRAIKKNVSIALLTLPELEQNLCVVKHIRSRNKIAEIISLAKNPEDFDLLKSEGANTVWNFYEEAGRGFADHVSNYLEAKLNI